MLQTHKHSLIALGVFVLLLIVSASVILYAKGYRFGFDAGRIGFSGTGLLVATSTPNGAQVFVNDHLTTATDNTINLAPGEYNVRIFKEGYFPWQKKVKIQKEAVTKAEALLFPKAPTLESLTDTGANNPVLDPTQTRIAFTIASQSARQNGVYVLDLSTRPILTLQNTATQLVDDTADLFSQSVLSWSPDSGQLLASVSARTGFSTNYLLSTGGFNSAPQDVTETLANVKSTWADLAAKKQTSRLAGLKVAARKMITDNFSIVAWSPDETKILYTASQSANLPIVITPRLIDVDTTPEERTIEKGNAYIYDIKEDKNYKVAGELTTVCEVGQPAVCHFPLQWFPDSLHLIYVHSHKIDIMEDDGTNDTTVYAGPFIDNYVFPWSNGSKVVILTNLNNPDIAPNLYTIGLK